MTAHRSRHGVLAVLVATSILIGACGDGSSSPSQPAARDTHGEEGLLDRIPRYPRSEPLARASEQGGVTVQTFGVEGTTPEQVLDWYRDELAGWTSVRRPRPFGRTAWRGVWERQDQRLLVSAGPAPTLEQDPADIEQTTTQYSLTLGEPGERVLTPT
jgi:hypothetical protein